MHPAVRTLYKEMLIACRRYPGGMTEARTKLQTAFRAQSNLDTTDALTLKAALDRGSFVLAELRALEKLHKYRYVKVVTMPVPPLASREARKRGLLLPLYILDTTLAHACSHFEPFFTTVLPVFVSAMRKRYNSD
jgi:hypothetical protein